MAKPITCPFKKCNPAIFFVSLFIQLNLTNAADNYESDIQKSNISFIGTRFNIFQNGDTPNRYIWLHGDEKTAKMALKYHIDRYGGLHFSLKVNKKIPSNLL